MKSQHACRQTGHVAVRAGFTLIELVLALGIGLIIFFVAATTIQQTAGISSRANATLEVMVTSRSALSILEQDLAGAFLEPGGDLFAGPNVPLGIENMAGEIAPDTMLLGFRSTSPAAYYDGSPPTPAAGSQVYYFVDADSALVRYDFPVDTPLATIDATERRRKALIYGVTRFEVRYFDGMVDPASGGNPDPWVTSWDSSATSSVATQERRLPAFVHVTLEVVDRRGYLGSHGRPPLHVERVMPVGTRAPAQ